MSRATERPKRSRLRIVDARLTPYQQWSTANQGVYAHFRTWLKSTGCGKSTQVIYCAAVHKALAWLNKPYWQIDPETELEPVRAFLAEHLAPATLPGYANGLRKFAHYLRLRARVPAPPKPLNWNYYLAGVPAWLGAAVQAYLRQCERNWPVDQRAALAMDTASRLTAPLRWLAGQYRLDAPADLTVKRWWAYADARLAEGLQPVTVNGALGCVQGWLRHLAEQGQPVDQRLLKLKPLPKGPRLPKDVPPAQLAKLLAAVQAAAGAAHGGVRRMGIMDQAWVLLMLHSGLRTGEVRRLKLGDVDWERRRARIEQSKGLKDRLVPLSDPGLMALRAYLAVRGPADALPPQVFIYRHAALTESYCGQRLRKAYGRQVGLHITPHQLRHSCATLLLNAGAPVLTVQTILGHRHIDTTLGYARLYDGTVAADYYRAMAQVEARFGLAEPAPPAHAGELLVLLDGLRAGTLNPAQAETLGRLRLGLLALAEQAAGAGALA